MGLWFVGSGVVEPQLAEPSVGDLVIDDSDYERRCLYVHFHQLRCLESLGVVQN